MTLWNGVAGGAEQHELRAAWRVTAVVCVRTAAGRPVAVAACVDGAVRAWDGTDTVTLARYRPKTDREDDASAWERRATAVAARIVRGSLLLATGDTAGRVTIWRTPAGARALPRCGSPADTFSLAGDDPVRSLEFAPDGRLVVGSDDDVFVFGPNGPGAT
ncbi:hypothetical protein [Streptomyces sp. NPDC101115]|uniref:hypothetical protein n=1 Tax=Streptomyces sp. NPDC101115 TaxID=3366106 RepID=UPI0038110937